MRDLKIGDLVEDCSLMPGIIMTLDGDKLGIRRLDFTNEETPFKGCDGKLIFSQCSASNCGIIKITPQQALNRLNLGKEKLTEIWNKHQDVRDYYKEIDKL